MLLCLTNITHRSFNASNVELIFEAYRESMQRPSWDSVFGKIGVKLLRILNRSIEKGF